MNALNATLKYVAKIKHIKDIHADLDTRVSNFRAVAQSEITKIRQDVCELETRNAEHIKEILQGHQHLERKFATQQAQLDNLINRQEKVEKDRVVSNVDESAISEVVKKRMINVRFVSECPTKQLA